MISALKVKLTLEKKDRLVRPNTIDEATYDLFRAGASWRGLVPGA